MFGGGGGGCFLGAGVRFRSQSFKKSKGDTDGSRVNLTAAVKKKTTVVHFDYHKAAVCKA